MPMMAITTNNSTKVNADRFKAGPTRRVIDALPSFEKHCRATPGRP
jgi:hypothetical protein